MEIISTRNYVQPQITIISYPIAEIKNVVFYNKAEARHQLEMLGSCIFIPQS